MQADAADALLRSLAIALIHGTTLAWCVEHARDGDPLPAAWAACEDARTLTDVYGATRGERVWWYESHEWAVGHRERYWHLLYARRVDRVLLRVLGEPTCDAIRAHVPTLTLADVLAARRAA